MQVKSLSTSCFETQEISVALACLNHKSGLKGTGTVCHTVVNFWGPIRHQTSNSPSVKNPWWAHFYASHLTKDLVTSYNDKIFLNTKSISPTLNLCIHSTINYQWEIDFWGLVYLISEEVRGNPYGYRWKEPSFAHFCMWFGKPKKTDKSQEKRNLCPAE